MSFSFIASKLLKIALYVKPSFAGKTDLANSKILCT
jgi:hypothetical protein